MARWSIRHIAGGLALAAAAVLALDWWTVLPEGTRPTYVGRSSCAQCHAEQLRQWTGSDHDLAMDLATPETVLGDFNQATLTHFGVTSTMTRTGDQFFITTEGPTGALETYSIKYTFGVRPLQQYMVEFPGGRVQVLSVAWDTVQKKWFDLHERERIEPGDWLHWTQGAGNWNFMCADCHSTNLRKNFDLASRTYHTEFSEIDVSCEACHGPGSTHVELAQARSFFWDRKLGYGLAQLKGGTADNELQACARCHSHRRVVAGDYHVRDRFLDHFEPQLPSSGLYHVDGQILEEVYEYGSFLQSRMYREGVKCSNCHNPHSLQLKFTGNQLCLQCHTLNKGNYDSPAHHRHKPEGAGASCVACHMPTKTYMVVDPRRDHSIRVPRPDLTVKLGVPNACQTCHNKPQETAEWAAAQIVTWYGPKRKDDPHFGEIFQHAGSGDPASLDDLIGLTNRHGARDQAKNVGPVVRAGAASYLSLFPGSRSQEQTLKLLDDPEPLVRLAATRAWSAFAQQPNAPRSVRDPLLQRLDDPVRLVRSEAAKQLTSFSLDGLEPQQRQRFETVLAEWRDGLREIHDDAGAHIELGMAAEGLGDLAGARQSYETALGLWPNDVQAIQARANLALLAHQEGRNDETERRYREVIELAQETIRKLTADQARDPDHPTIRLAIEEQRRRLAGWELNLGLLLAGEADRRSEGVVFLRQAAAHDPVNARIKYNLGIVYREMNQPDAAVAMLEAACASDPRMIDARHALTLLLRAQRRWNEARASAEQLVVLDPRYQGLLQTIIAEGGQRSPVGPTLP